MTDPVFLTPDQIRPGVYVMLDLPWFRHPFAVNHFLVESAQQVQLLRGLGLTRLRWDPARSHLSDSDAVPAPDAASQPDAAMGLPSPTDPAQADAAGGRVLSAAEQADRTQSLQAWRGRVHNLERAFLKASGVVKNLSRDMLTRPHQALRDTGALVDDMVSVFLESPDTTLQVMGGRVGGDEVYHHSLNVTILSVMLAHDLGLSPDEAKALGVGAMLHDVGLVDVSDKVLLKDPLALTRAERGARALHVEYGVEIARKAGVAPGSLAVIAQHHELADGSGYPNGLRLDQISLPARVVAVANAYDNLCNPFDQTKALTPHEALSYLYTQRRGQFDARVLQTLIRNLGVYPPGTVVQLMPEALAVVVAVNPNKPLRPCVLLHDPAVPADQALVLDLATSPNYSIVRALRPGALTPSVAAYLSPRRRVVYFFDAGAAVRGSE